MSRGGCSRRARGTPPPKQRGCSRRPAGFLDPPPRSSPRSKIYTQPPHRAPWPVSSIFEPPGGQNGRPNRSMWTISSNNGTAELAKPSSPSASPLVPRSLLPSARRGGAPPEPLDDGPFDGVCDPWPEERRELERVPGAARRDDQTRSLRVRGDPEVL